jgi:hypothetical protein
MRADEQEPDMRPTVAEFMGFVRREDANSGAAMESLLVGGTQEAAAQPLGMTEAQFSRAHNQLLQLGRCFLSHEPIPMQRKPYNKRVKVEIVLSFATAA